MGGMKSLLFALFVALLMFGCGSKINQLGLTEKLGTNRFAFFIIVQS